MRGTYYVTVEGSLAYRLSQWLTSRLESEMEGRRYRDDDEDDDDDDDLGDWY